MIDFVSLRAMLSQEIRKAFFDAFKKRGHAFVPSAPVIPQDDPTLLFTNAGMNQFKDLFLGKSTRSYNRAVSTQKCIRVGGKHNDLENVGHTARHLTFFEMLGNFSFGDYFKKEAIDFAWDVTLNVFGFDPKFLFATVFEEDTESYELWKNYLPEERIVYMGAKDNFWSMGDTGPCGPCSELYYDKGEKFGDAKDPSVDLSGERFLEFWNLVFIEFNRDPSGQLTPLKKKSVDTGAGLERVCELKMGVDTVFQTDILKALIEGVEKSENVTYTPEKAPAFHVIADHIRTLAFAIADGAIPSNTDRGYVLRKVLRRAVRYGRTLGIERPFLANSLPLLTKLMGDDFPELKASEKRARKIILMEEENFLRTLRRGGTLLAQVIEHSKIHGNCISGDDAFKLKDTYGLPLDEILLLANDSDLTVDIKRFEELETQARQRSKQAHKKTSQMVSESAFEAVIEKNGPNHFLGYTQLNAKGTVLALFVDGEPVNTLKLHQTGEIILDQTPFYPEKGGQVGDTGELEGNDCHFKVSDTLSHYPGVISHVGEVTRGEINVDACLSATVDAQRRHAIEQNHTATHLLHWALQEVLGESATQAGSIVLDDRLRFDFNHMRALTADEIRTIERLVNSKIRSDQAVKTHELTLEEAQKDKKIKQFFQEKYGQKVRVVDIDFSKELCGGTHVSAVGKIGYFRIVRESAIAAGVRRIEAVTATSAEEIIYETEDTLGKLEELFSVQTGQIIERASRLVEENKVLSDKVSEMQSELLAVEVENLVAHIEVIANVSVLVHSVPQEAKELKILSDILMQKQPSLAAFLTSTNHSQCTFIIRVSADLVKQGLHAGQLLKEIAPIVGGKGGGRADFAQGGGRSPENIEQALTSFKELVGKTLST